MTTSCMKYSNVVYFSFIFSLFAMQMMAWIDYFMNIYFFWPRIIFGLYYILLFPTICLKNYTFDRFDLNVAFFLLYIISITIIMSGSNVVELVTSINGMIFPFLLYLFFKIALKSKEKVLVFLKLIVYGGAVAAFFVIFEMATSITNYFPLYGHVLAVTTQKRGLYLALDVNAFYGNQASIWYLRPLGIFLDMNRGGFLMLSALLIVTLLKELIFTSKKKILCIQILLAIGVFAQGSKQEIVLMAGSMLLLTLYSITQRNRDVRLYKKIRSSLLVFCGFLVIMVMFLYERFEVLFGSMLGISAQQKSTLVILKDHFAILINELLPERIERNPLKMFFGYGTYTPDTVMGTEFHFFEHQLSLMGFVGFCFYWGIFLGVIFLCHKALKRSNRRKHHEHIFLLGIMLTLIFMGNLAHFSPLNACNYHIIALALFIGDFAYRYNKGIDSPIHVYST